MKTTNSIDDVIKSLEVIIGETVAAESALGYFAVLYHKVTVKVKIAIGEDFFDDGLRMEKLDIVFAQRYIEAYYSWKQNRPVSASWEAAFSLAENNQLLVIQHLLLGMNAHINYDLGIAAAEVSNEHPILDLEGDFNKINEILAALVDEVQNGLSSIWPFLRKILRWSGKIDNYIVAFSMNIARDGAWKFATTLATTKNQHRAALLKERDEKIARKSQIITEPGKWVQFLFWIIRISETGTTVNRIKQLQG